MITFASGDRVVVEFQGVDCEGEVIGQSAVTGFVMARVTIPDPEVDFGSIGSRLDPEPVVCVPAKRVRLNTLQHGSEQRILGIASGIPMPPNPH